MSYITRYRQLLDIIKKNDKNMLVEFIKSVSKTNEFIDLCSKINVYDNSKCTIFNYIASNSGKFNSFLAFFSLILCFILKDFLELLEIILRNANKKNEIIKKYGIEALMSAISNKNLEGVKLLIDFGANINQQSRYGWSTMHEAACIGSTEILQFLLDCGANVNIKDNEHKTPLHIACDNCNFKMVKLLKYNGCDVEQIDKCGWTALHISCGHDDVETVKFLIENGASLNTRDKDGNRPLNWAINFHSFQVLKYVTSILSKKESFIGENN
jgi:ankyrin repeat protein